MKFKIFLILIELISFINSKIEYTSTISFSSSGISSSGDGVNISGTQATISKSGSYLATGSSSEGNIIISVDSVNLYLENLELSSNITSPIIVNKQLENVKIISLGNVILQDLENENITTGECAVIKIKKKSIVTFRNEKDMKLIGKCKNVIKGGSLANIIFEESEGEYTINAYKNGISSDNLLQFNGGKFIISTETGDAVKSSPDDTDTVSLGKILINSGIFNIQSYSDGFQAANILIIKDGTFNIKTENGYDSTTFDKDTMSAKGFKVSNNATGSIIKVYNGIFNLNTADDAFHSNGNLTLINGNYQIYSGDDGIHAEFHLIIGTKDQTRTPIINILYCYEGLEGLSLRIYSGKINVTSTDDGINAAGGSNSDVDPSPGPGPGPGPGPHSSNHRKLNIGSKLNAEPGPHSQGNSSYFISIYGGECNVISAGDGLDSNGNIFIHGGDFNVFGQSGSEGSDNEPIDHDGNFTIFNGTLLAAGNSGMQQVHSGILKGNQMYAYYTQSISANQILKIKNENDEIIKETTFPKTVRYTFFTCKGLNNNYKFYLYDSDGKETEVNFNFGNPKSGSDDQDTKEDDGGKYDDDEEEDSDTDMSDETDHSDSSQQSDTSEHSDTPFTDISTDTSDIRSDDTHSDTSDIHSDIHPDSSDIHSDISSDIRTDVHSDDNKTDMNEEDRNTALIVSLSVFIPIIIILIIIIVLAIRKYRSKDISRSTLLNDNGEDVKLSNEE